METQHFHSPIYILSITQPRATIYTKVLLLLILPRFLGGICVLNLCGTRTCFLLATHSRRSAMARLPDLQVVTYHWSEADKSMIHTPLPKCNRLDYPPSAAPTSTAAFNQLPLEILHNVLQFLDIDTARSVRLLSWTIRSY